MIKNLKIYPESTFVIFYKENEKPLFNMLKKNKMIVTF